MNKQKTWLVTVAEEKSNLLLPHWSVARQDKTRQDIYYQNITCTISWHAVSWKTLVVACQINSITKQILQIISKQQKAETSTQCSQVCHYQLATGYYDWQLKAPGRGGGGTLDFKFSYPQKFPELKILNPKTSFDHPCHLKSEVPHPLGWQAQYFVWLIKFEMTEDQHPWEPVLSNWPPTYV